MRLARLATRSLAALALLASPAAAQSYLGSTGTATGAETLRARNLQSGTGDEVYLGASPSVLGSGSQRDSYGGTWNAGTAATRTYRFTMSWDGAGTLTFGLGQLLGGTPGLDDAPGVASSLSGSTFTLANVGSFDAFRLFSRSATSLNALTLDGVDMLPGAPVAFANAEHFWSVSSASAFEVAGSLDVAMNGNGEGTRFEVGVANSVVPEPSTYALLGTGIAALGLVGARRRRAGD